MTTILTTSPLDSHTRGGNISANGNNTNQKTLNIMTLNWEKIGIVAGAIVGAVVAFKVLPLGVSLTAIGCAVGGFFGGIYWAKKL